MIFLNKWLNSITKIQSTQCGPFVKQYLQLNSLQGDIMLTLFCSMTTIFIICLIMCAAYFQGSLWWIWLWEDPGVGGKSKADCLGDALQQDQLYHLPLQLCRCRGERQAESQWVPSLPLSDVYQQEIQRDYLTNKGQAL